MMSLFYYLLLVGDLGSAEGAELGSFLDLVATVRAYGYRLIAYRCRGWCDLLYFTKASGFGFWLFDSRLYKFRCSVC